MITLPLPLLLLLRPRLVSSPFLLSAQQQKDTVTPAELSSPIKHHQPHKEAHKLVNWWEAKSVQHLNNNKLHGKRTTTYSTKSSITTQLLGLFRCRVVPSSAGWPCELLLRTFIEHTRDAERTKENRISSRALTKSLLLPHNSEARNGRPFSRSLHLGPFRTNFRVVRARYS